MESLSPLHWISQQSYPGAKQRTKRDVLSIEDQCTTKQCLKQCLLSMHNKESNPLECSHSPSALHPTSTNVYIFVWIFCWAFFATFKKTGGLLMEKQQLLFTAPRVVVYSKELELTGAQIQWESPEKGWPKHTWNHWKEWSIHLKPCSSYEFYWKTHELFVCWVQKEPSKILETNKDPPHFWIPKLPPRVQLKGD